MGDAVPPPVGSRPAWIERLLESTAYPHPVGAIKLIETHISWVFLTGPFAYKVKKPLALEFLDFSTLERRRHFCAEEVRLNSRFAPELYLAAVPITGSPESPHVDGPGEALEWAVKLVQFDEGNRLDALFCAGRLTAADCRRLGESIATVQKRHAVADPTAENGTVERLEAVFRMNLDEIRRHYPGAGSRADSIEDWLEGGLARDHGAFEQRVATGKIRECHGDLHLANLVLWDGRPVAFDSIEFNPDLRWIDVASDIAFLTMDLESRGRPDLAADVTSAWIEAADDHQAAAVLPWYRVARAVVRAAVAAIRCAQADCSAGVADEARTECDRYLDLARRLMSPPPPQMVVICGVSGSGKSTLATAAIGLLGAVCLRSDVERKRLFQMAATDRPRDDAQRQALYSAEVTQRVYERLAALAGGLLASGAGVVVDATCTTRRSRALLTAVARTAGVKLVWIEIDIPTAVLLVRVAARQADGRDASDASVDIVRAQTSAREPILAEELAAAAGPHSPPALHLRVAADDLADPARFLTMLKDRVCSHPLPEMLP